jgi:hypothetical protein
MHNAFMFLWDPTSIPIFMVSYKILLVEIRQLVIINDYIIGQILYVNFFLTSNGKKWELMYW